MECRLIGWCVPARHGRRPGLYLIYIPIPAPVSIAPTSAIPSASTIRAVAVHGAGCAILGIAPGTAVSAVRITAPAQQAPQDDRGDSAEKEVDSNVHCPILTMRLAWNPAAISENSFGLIAPRRFSRLRIKTDFGGFASRFILKRDYFNSSAANRYSINSFTWVATAFSSQARDSLALPSVASFRPMKK